MVELTHNPIQAADLMAKIGSTQAGGQVLFLGTTRQWTNGRATLWLDYECYHEMALKKMTEIEQEAHRRWPLVASCIVHRLGRVELGEASVGIAVASAHRGPAFEACHWLIDTLKQVVPIWKKENWADGQSEWVHPT